MIVKQADLVFNRARRIMQKSEVPEDEQRAIRKLVDALYGEKVVAVPTEYESVLAQVRNQALSVSEPFGRTLRSAVDRLERRYRDRRRYFGLV